MLYTQTKFGYFSGVRKKPAASQKGSESTAREIQKLQTSK